MGPISGLRQGLYCVGEIRVVYASMRDAELDELAGAVKAMPALLLSPEVESVSIAPSVVPAGASSPWESGGDCCCDACCSSCVAVGAVCAICRLSTRSTGLLLLWECS